MIPWIRALASNSLLHKSSALVIGFLLWSQLTQLHKHTLTLTVPVFFYGNEVDLEHISAPESVTVTLRGHKKDLIALDKKALSVHIDSERLRAQNNKICLTHKDLFLPDCVSVLHYTPLPFIVVKK